MRSRYFETVNESWIYAYEPESKQQSTVWVFQVEPNPTKFARARFDLLSGTQPFVCQLSSKKSG